MNMKKAVTIILTIALVLGVYGVAHAANNTATQSVTFRVDAINEISVSGDPGTLVIYKATPGRNPTPATDSSTKYAITTNGTGMKITAKIDTNMPTGLTLMVNLEAPNRASSPGDVVLIDNEAKAVVTEISQVAQDNLTITYTLEATAQAAEVSYGMKTVTFTLTDA